MLDFDIICEDVFYSNWFLILSESLTQADKIEIFNIALTIKKIKTDKSIDFEQKKELYKQLREKLKAIYLGSIHIAADRKRVLTNIEDYLDNNIMRIKETPAIYKLTPESAKFLVYLLRANL